MKNATRILMAVILCVGWQAKAQQWSDVGAPGFTNDPLAGVSQVFTYAPNMTIYNGVPHVVYNLGDGQLAVMKYASGVWTALPTPNTGPNAPSVLPQIAADASGNVYICYKNNLSVPGFPAIITVKKFNGTSWSTVGTAGFTAGIAYGMAINPVTNNPVVATRDPFSRKISVYQFNGTSWAALGATDFSNTTGLLRLAISATGTPYVVFEDTSNSGKFSVMRYDGTSWVYVGPASFGETGTLADLTLDIAIDGSGVPHTITKSLVNGKASVLKFNGTAWVTVGQTEFTSGTFKQSRLKFSTAGVLHMAYQDGALANRASVMKFNGTSWVAAGNLGFSGGEARYLDIAFASEVPFVLYRDALQLSSDKASVMKLCASNASTVGSVTPASSCGAGAITLSATSTTGTLRWYNDSANGAFVGTGTSYTTPTLSTTTTYSIAAYDMNGCSSPRTAVVATVNVIPTAANAISGTRCGPGTVTISASAFPGGGTLNWFAASTGGASLGTGLSFTTPTISTTTTYYAEAFFNGCTAASRIPVVAEIREIPTIIGTVPADRCGNGSVTLSATASPSAVIRWYDVPSGGSLLVNTPLYTTPSLTSTTTYYVEAFFNTCTSPSRTAVVSGIKPIPTVTSTTPANRCGDGTLNLSATVSNSGIALWYNVSTGGTPLGNSLSFTTPSIANTTNFHVEAFLNGCASPSRTAVVATINPFPTVSSADVTRCDAGTVTFEASSAGTISWFAASTGGSALASGPNYTTPSISVTTPYFAQAILNGCVTPTRTQVQAIVVASPPQPTISQNNSNIEAPVLTSSASNGNQWFKDGNLIAGATAATYTITDMGEYAVQVNNSGCLSPFSDAVLYIITGAEVADEEMLKLYPNPTTDELVVNLNGFDTDRVVSIAVVDLMGRVQTESSALGGGDVRFKVNQYSAGQYLVLARQGNKKLVRSFIKSR